jgi:GTPase SAR1 family protein
MDGKTILINLLDTSGSSEYEQLRPISYNGVDIFLIVFSVVNPNSLENIRQWVEECKQYAPDKNIMLVGTKTDLRLDDNTVSKLKQRQLSPLYSTHGENMATEIKAIKYLECSAKDVKSVHRVFEEAIRSISLVPEKRPAHSYTVMEANESFVQQNKRTLSLRLTPFVFAMSRSDPIVLPMSRSDPIDF